MKLKVRYIKFPGSPGKIIHSSKDELIQGLAGTEKKVFIDGKEVSTDPLYIPDGTKELCVIDIPQGNGDFWDGFLSIVTFGIYGQIKSAKKASQEAKRAQELAQKFSNINTPSPASSIRGSNNSFRATGRLPIVLGSHYLTPDLAGVPYTSYKNDEQWFHQIFCLGYRDVVYSDLKIGENKVSNYVANFSEGIEYYPKIVSEINLGLELTYNQSITKTTPQKTVKINVGIYFPSGLRRYDENADERSFSVSFEVSYRPVGGSWVAHNFSIVEMKDYVRRMFSFSVNQGSYEVRVKRTSSTPDSEGAEVYMDSAYWDVLQSEVVSSSFTLPLSTKALTDYNILSMQIKATGQTNGIIDELNVLAELRCLDYCGTGTGASAWIYRKSRNPASALLYVLQNPLINKKALNNYQINWMEFEEFHRWCNEKGFTFDAVLTGDYTLNDVTEMITFAGRAHLTYINGVYGVRIERATDSIDFQLTPRNTKGSMTMTKSFTGNVRNLTCSFIDRSSGFVEVSRTCSISPEGEIVYDNPQDGETTEVNFVGITDPDHAMKIAAYELVKASRRVITYSVPQDWEQLTAFPGAVGYLASDMFLYGLGSGKIKTVYGDQDSGSIIAVEVDTELLMQIGKEYSLMIRMNGTDDGIRIFPVQNTGTSSSVVTFEVAISGGIEKGNLFIFGERGAEGRRVLCESISPGIDQDGTLQLVDYAEEIFDADSGTIPVWDSGVTLPESSSSAVAYSIEDQLAKIHKETNLQLAQKPTVEQLWEGYSYEKDGVPVATIIPEPPDLLVSSSGRDIYLSWSRQFNLTGGSIRYEIQILDHEFNSEDILEGYSIGSSISEDINSWRGELGGVSYTSNISMVIQGVPLSMTDGYSVPRKFYFRVRCRQSNERVSEWSSCSITVAPLDSTSMAKDSVSNQMIQADSINETQIMENAITTKHLRADIISSLTASFDANVIIGDKGFVGANYNLGTVHDYTEADKRAYIDSDELTFQEVKSVNNNIPTWADTLKIGGARQELEFLKASKRMGYNLDGENEVSIAFAKRRDTYPENISAGYGAEIKSKGPISIVDSATDKLKIIYDPITNNIVSEGVRLNGNSLDALPVGTIIMFDPNTANTIDGNTVESGKSGEWIDNLTLPGWYACVDGNQEKGCPNLVDRFVMGRYTSGIGVIGGANTVALTETQIPSHLHSNTHDHSASIGSVGAHTHIIWRGLAKYNSSTTGHGFDNPSFSGSSGSAGGHGHTISVNSNENSTGLTGGGQAFDNRPAYYSLIYIRKCEA